MGFRECKKCMAPKPPRSHHCKICGHCVMRMDHHCPWTGNCIGLKTHKFFICFLFWTIMACLHVAISTPLLNQNYHVWLPTGFPREVMEKYRPLDPMIAPVLALGVTFGVSMLFCMHWSFICRNETTIEYADLMMNDNPYRLRYTNKNIEQILGPNKS